MVLLALFIYQINNEFTWFRIQSIQNVHGNLQSVAKLNRICGQPLYLTLEVGSEGQSLWNWGFNLWDGTLLQVPSVGSELSCRTPSWWCRVLDMGKPTHVWCQKCFKFGSTKRGKEKHRRNWVFTNPVVMLFLMWVFIFISLMEEHITGCWETWVLILMMIPLIYLVNLWKPQHLLHLKASTMTFVFPRIVTRLCVKMRQLLFVWLSTWHF